MQKKEKFQKNMMKKIKRIYEMGIDKRMEINLKIGHITNVILVILQKIILILMQI